MAKELLLGRTLMCRQGCQETLNKRNSLDAGYWNGGLMARSHDCATPDSALQLSQPFLLAGAESRGLC